MKYKRYEDDKLRNCSYKLPERLGEVGKLRPAGGMLMKTVYFILLSFICLTLCHSTNSHNYRYDDLYRLIHAEGEQVHTDTTKYTLDMAYDVMGNPLYKKEDILSGGNLSQESSDILYSYTHDKPNAASWIGNRMLNYDKNGNVEYWTDTLTNGYRRFQWNEDNQLLGLEENGYISRYTYDSQGERVIKAHGGIQGVFINGAPAASIIKAEQITTYISPFMTVTGGHFTKHYYAGTKRIASKIGNGTFNNQYRPGSHNILAGGVNCIERYNQIEQNKKEYIRSLGVPPGPPTMKGIYAEPEYTGQAFPDGGTPQNTAPDNWPRKPVQAPPGGPPGPPVQYGPDITNETANGGFGFITTGHIEETDRYFYHSDHLGSSSYITDWKGNVSQFMVYLPFGELLVDKHVTGKSEMPYKFNAKEKDEETGLYYYGARYYNGKDQVWMGVDPAWEKYPEVSPYAYCANNPVKYVDPDGKDLVLMINKEAAEGKGHIAVLIGNKKDGWTYYSINGTSSNSENTSSSPWGKSRHPDVGVVLKDKDGNLITDRMAAINASNTVNPEATHSYKLSMTIASTPEEDASMKGSASEAASVSNYGIAGPGNSCIDVAQAAFGDLVKNRKLDDKGKVLGNGDWVPNNWFDKLPSRVSKINKNATETKVDNKLLFIPYEKNN